MIRLPLDCWRNNGTFSYDSVNLTCLCAEGPWSRKYRVDSRQTKEERDEIDFCTADDD